MPGNQLTREDIVETTGLERLEELEDLEVLFLTFKEIGGLQHCPNLRRLSLIDNGIERINNLAPVSVSLRVLCMCDQNVTSLENLELPNLRELYLHRNNIESIDSLARCPRIQKLWLFQNQLTSLQFLHSLAELEECWLQCNQISSLSSLSNASNLKDLNLANNPLDDLAEVKHLVHLSRLCRLTFNDIHFGKCDLVDEEGYRNYMVLLLKQVGVLDGVMIKREHQAQAESEYYAQVRAFNDSLKEIEDSYQKSLRAIDQQHQSREAYSSVLEKEMSAALKELQGLVNEGRSVINKEVNAVYQLADRNFLTLQDSLDKLAAAVTQKIQHFIGIYIQQFYESNYLLSLLDGIYTYHNAIMSCLCGIKKGRSIAYAIVNNSSADFLMFASVIDPDILNGGSPVPVPARKSPKKKGQEEPVMEGDGFVLELAKLYKVIIPNGKYNQTAVEGVTKTIYTAVALEDLQTVLTDGWSALQSRSSRYHKQSQLFADSPGMLATLLSPLLDPLDIPSKEGKSSPSKRNSSLVANAAAGYNSDVIGRPVVVLGFEVNTVLAQIGGNSLHGSKVLSLALPSTESQRAVLLDSIYSANYNGNTACFVSNDKLIYNIPYALCEMSMSLEYIALCMQHYPLTAAVSDAVYDATIRKRERTGLLKGLESKLELLLLPTHHVQSTAQLLQMFEEEAADLLQSYVVKMLEEVDEAQAKAFQSAEREVQMREQALKGVREEIEGERRMQEGQLRELRAISAASNTNGTTSSAKFAQNRR